MLGREAPSPALDRPANQHSRKDLTMQVINIRSGISLKEAPAKKIPFYRLLKKAAELFGEVYEIRIKGVFCHYQYNFMGCYVCYEPMKETTHYIAIADPEIGETKKYIRLTSLPAGRFYLYGELK